MSAKLLEKVLLLERTLGAGLATASESRGAAALHMRLSGTFESSPLNSGQNSAAGSPRSRSPAQKVQAACG